MVIGGSDPGIDNTQTPVFLCEPFGSITTMTATATTTILADNNSSLFNQDITTPTNDGNINTPTSTPRGSTRCTPPNPLEDAYLLPGYLLFTVGRLELLSLSDVEEETNEVGDGGDSDELKGTI
jgi:hypothetical protein